jgi:uncharacterized protein (DUF58 family)
VGILTYGAASSSFAPPRGGRVGRITVARRTRHPTSDETGATDLDAALRRATRLAKRGCVVAVVGDLRGPRNWNRSFVQLCARCEVIVIEIRDPREMELVDVGHLRLVDPETGRHLEVNTSSRKLRTRFSTAAAVDRDDVARMIRDAGARHIVLSTEGSWLGDLARFLKRRAS